MYKRVTENGSRGRGNGAARKRRTEDMKGQRKEDEEQSGTPGINGC